MSSCIFLGGTTGWKGREVELAGDLVVGGGGQWSRPVQKNPRGRLPPNRKKKKKVACVHFHSEFLLRANLHRGEGASTSVVPIGGEPRGVFRRVEGL